MNQTLKLKQTDYKVDLKEHVVSILGQKRRETNKEQHVLYMQCYATGHIPMSDIFFPKKFYDIFLIYVPNIKHAFWVLVRLASLRRF